MCLDWITVYLSPTFSLHLYVHVVRDLTPPVITYCPADIIRQVNTGQQSIAISWTEPTATDDITPANQIISVSSHQPNQLFTVGTNIITYLFRDEAGNDVRCSFSVVVQGQCFYPAVSQNILL